VQNHDHIQETQTKNNPNTQHPKPITKKHRLACCCVYKVSNGLPNSFFLSLPLTKPPKTKQKKKKKTLLPKQYNAKPITFLFNFFLLGINNNNNNNNNHHPPK
jgi:hypothetical protein